MRFMRIIASPLRYMCMGLIYVYKFTVSPLKPKTCIYQPTCSTYTLIAIQRFGVLRGCFLGAKRIWRCRPKFKGGLDRVPDDIKGNVKFLV